jgi:excisionase family DNA binding protein
MLPDTPAYTLTPELADAPRLLTTGKVASVLACSHRTAANLITSGKLPAVRLGGPGTAYRVSRDALADFITKHATQPPGEAA